MACNPRRCAARVAGFAPDMTVVTTAPSYLFWRCAPPELRVPLRLVRWQCAAIGGTLVAVGPHGSTTPRTPCGSWACRLVVMGECEECSRGSRVERSGPGSVRSAYRDGDDVVVQGGRTPAAFTICPPCGGPTSGSPATTITTTASMRSRPGPGAEVEASRGCPYHCTFCAKDEFSRQVQAPGPARS